MFHICSLHEDVGMWIEIHLQWISHKFIIAGDETTTADPNASTSTDPNASSTADPNTTTTVDPNVTTTTESDLWEENDMIWSVDQCPSILWFNGITLKECQDFCSSVSTCTAINFGQDSGHCTLLNCGYPCPEPQWSAANYKGYCLMRGIFIQICWDIPASAILCFTKL